MYMFVSFVKHYTCYYIIVSCKLYHIEILLRQRLPPGEGRRLRPLRLQLGRGGYYCYLLLLLLLLLFIL